MSDDKNFDPSKSFMAGPFELEMKVSITDDERSGTVTYTMGRAEIPTAQDIKTALEACANDAAKAGFRLMNRSEFMSELLGQNVAVPGPKNFPDAADWQAIFDAENP